jgi:hypothetical protein
MINEDNSFASESSFAFASEDESCNDTSNDVEAWFGGMSLGPDDSVEEDAVCCSMCRLEVPAELLECHGCEVTHNQPLCKEKTIHTSGDVQALLLLICTEMNDMLESHGEIDAICFARILKKVGTEPNAALVEGMMAAFGKRPTEVVTLEDFLRIQRNKQIQQMNTVLVEGG